MDDRTKIALSAYALIYAAAAMVAFRFGDLVPIPTVYVLLGFLYLLPIWLAVTGRTNTWLRGVLLVVTPLLPALIVIDPLEMGFYGYDPYGTLQTVIEFREIGVVHIARSELFAWPGFYAFLWMVISIIGLPVETVGKYIPLVAVGAPLLFYLFARRLTQQRLAFIAAMGFAGIRTLYDFQVKFIDETTAFVLFFTLIFLILVHTASRGSAISYLSLLVAAGAVLTHHYVGALVLIFVILWDLSEFEYQQIGRKRNMNCPFSRLSIIAGTIFIVMLFIVTPQFLGFLISVADINTSPSSEILDTPQGPDDSPRQGHEGGGPDSGRSTASSGSDNPTVTHETEAISDGSVGTHAETDESAIESLIQTIIGYPFRFWQLLVANIILITILAIVVTTIPRWAIDTHPALTVSGVFGCILAVGYGYSVAFGPILPLDPSRYLLYMTAMLLIPTGYALQRIDFTIDSTTMFTTLVVLLIITQLTIVPPPVMYSNQAQTRIGEGHYSPAQFAASDWVSEYDGNQIVAWEDGLWRAKGIWNIGLDSDPSDCSVLRVWRQDAPPDYRQPSDIVVYSSGSMELYRCTKS